MAKCISCPATSEYQDKPFTCYVCSQNTNTQNKVPFTPVTTGPATVTLYYFQSEFDEAVKFIVNNHRTKWGQPQIIDTIKDLMLSLAKDPSLAYTSMMGVTVFREENYLEILVSPSLGVELGDLKDIIFEV